MASGLDISGRALIPLGTTQRRALDLTALRGDLAALWRQEGHGIIRACHSTLVVCNASAQDQETLLEDLVRARPSRVIWLEPGSSPAGAAIEAWASGLCFRRPGSDGLICSETIHLRAGPGADFRIASVVRSLTVGGLPLEVLVLEGSPLEIAWLGRLANEVDRVLFRSARLEIGECLTLWESCQSRSKPPIFDDLTWAALEGWRAVVASRFEGEEAARLQSLRRVVLSLDGSALQPALALLFAGWLGSRLEWTNVRRRSGSPSASGLVPGAALSWTLSGPDGAELSLLVQTTADANPNQGLRTVEFGFEGSTGTRSWHRNPSEGTWEVEDRGAKSVRRSIPALPETGCTSILRALRSSRRDATPGEAMCMARQLGEARLE